MSDPRTDFFAEGAADAPDDATPPTDARTAFFGDDKPLPVPKTPGASEPEPDTWFNAVKGLGDAGLAVGSSGLKAVTHAVNDILPGAEGRAKLEKEIQTDPVLNYHPQTEGGKTAMDALSTVFSPVSWAANKAHEAIAGATNERTAWSSSGRTSSRRHAPACTSMAVSPATAVELPPWNEGQRHPAKLGPDRRIVVQNVVQLAP